VKWNIDYELKIKHQFWFVQTFSVQKTPLHLKVKDIMESEHVTLWLSHAFSARGRKKNINSSFRALANQQHSPKTNTKLTISRSSQVEARQRRTILVRRRDMEQAATALDADVLPTAAKDMMSNKDLLATLLICPY